jgi:hypothetical protein
MISKKLKDIWRTDAKITIRTLLERTKEKQKNSSCISNKEILINVRIDKGDYNSSMSFPLTKKGKRQALDFINEELYWKSIVSKMNIQKSKKSERRLR